MQPLQADVIMFRGAELGAGGDHLLHQFVRQPVDIADEVAYKFRFGKVIDLVGRSDLLNHTLIEHRDPVRKGQGLLLVVGDIDGGNAEFLLHFFQFVSQLNPELGVQVGQRLIHADDGRACDQSPGNGHPLLLAAGELGDRLHQLLIRQIHLPGDVSHLPVNLRLFQLLDLQAEGNVVIHRHGGKQGIALKHDADVSVLNGHVGNIPVLHHHRTGHRLNEACEGAQGGCLPAAGGAEKGEEFPLFYMYIDAVQCGEITEFDDDIIEPDHIIFPFSSREAPGICPASR